MRILQIAPQVPLPADHGGRISIWGITKYLSELGHEIHFVTYRKDSNQQWAEKELKKFCIPYILDYFPKNNVFSALRNLFTPVPYNIAKFQSAVLKKFLFDFFKNNEVDIVHIDHLHMAWTLAEIRKYSNVPVVLREHNLEIKIMQRFYLNAANPIIKKYAEIQYNKFVKYEPSMCSRFDTCIMITPNDAEELLKMNNSAKTSVIPVGVSKDLLGVKKNNIEPYSMFHLGSLKWLPNFEGLKWFVDEILPEILKKIPHLKLYLYGEDAEKFTVPSQMLGNIIPVGYVENIWKETNNKSLLIVPLKTGSGIRVKIVEMMATGQNIISTSIGKEGILAEDAEHILIADTKEEFINKIVNYFSGKYNNAKMSENAKSIISSNYTWEKVAAAFEKVYSQVINS